MDKNFVNIDDLVRQRLGGGEEPERSGAWLNMRDLLDKEMPQDKAVGFLYWRRMMSAVAVLLLIATISVGGYELSASRNSNLPIAGNNNAIAPAIVAKSTNTSATSNETNTRQITASGIATNTPAKSEGNDNKKIAGNTSLKNIHNHKRLTGPYINNTQKGSNYADATTHTLNNNQLPVTANTAPGKNVNPSSAVNSPAAKTAGKDNVGYTDKTKTLAVVAGASGIHTLPTSKAIATKVAANIKNGFTKSPASAKMKELALGGHPSSVGHTKIASVHKTGIATITSGAKKSFNNRALTDRKKSGIATKPVNGNLAKKTIAKNDKNVFAGKAPAAATVSAKQQKQVAGSMHKAIKPKSGAVATKVAIGNVANEATAANEKKEKKVMQKLVLYEHERYIKTDPDNGYFNVDTISMHMLTQELPGAEENTPGTPAPAERQIAAARTAPATNNAPTTNSGTASIGSATTTTTDPQMLPGASASANGKPAMGQKQSATDGSSSGGAGALSGLASSFNDIKYHVNGVQFAAGLTAGINGTFFGPNSFKGFQFGVTGDFTFSEEWSFATELKYFERVNNNYTLNDNTTTYTPNGSGSYTMQQTTNIYNFSTLHSIEMPLIVRYTNGKFNFFVGGNLVYSFSINEGALQQQTTTITPASGPETQPKITSVTDFDSRFGIGCLFGLSYKLSPNVNIDLRNVMTLWDNASSSGARYVSDQLYKSPSLQLSLGYRLGSKKHKD